MTVYATMPRERVVPPIVTTFAVSLLKVGAIAGMIAPARWLAGKLRGDKS